MSRSASGSYSDTPLGRGWQLVDEVKKNNPDLDLCRRLIGADTDFSPHAGNGSSTLHWAAYGGHTEIVRMLLATGLDIDDIDCQGHTPLTFSILCGHEDLAIFLVHAGANPNLGDRSKNTPLVMAAYKNMVLLTEVLLDHGADRDMTDADGKKPAGIARALHNDAIAAILSEAPAARAARKAREKEQSITAATDISIRSQPRIQIRKKTI